MAIDRPLEEVIGAQALDVDQRVAVMACLSGRESRRWTVGELVERFKNLGLCASHAGVTAALAEVALELELAAWKDSPFRTPPGPNPHRLSQAVGVALDLLDGSGTKSLRLLFSHLKTESKSPRGANTLGV